MLPFLLAIALQQPRPPDLLKRAHTYSIVVANRTVLAALVNFMDGENYHVRVRMDGNIDRVVLDDILRRRRT
ncbi:MAG: hypothetical protein ACREMM_11075 [Gemmatimonadales bacterium]